MRSSAPTLYIKLSESLPWRHATNCDITPAKKLKVTILRCSEPSLSIRQHMYTEGKKKKIHTLEESRKVKIDKIQILSSRLKEKV